MRRLGQRVKAPVVQAAGDQVVTRALGRRAGHEGRLDFLEPKLTQVRADHLAGAMAQAQVALHAPATQIEIAEAQARLLARLGLIFNGEGRRLGLIQDQQVARHHFHFARRELRIRGFRRARYNFSLHAHHILGANLLRPVVHFRADGGIAHNLRPARMVAQIEEDQVAQIPPDVHPAGQEHLLPSVRFAQLTTVVRSLPVTQKI